MSHPGDDYSPVSGIESVSPFPPLEDYDDVGTPTAIDDNDEDDALHMKIPVSRRSRAGTTHSTIYTGPLSSENLREVETRTASSTITAPDASAESQDVDELVISPTVGAESSGAGYYVDNGFLDELENESLGEELEDDDGGEEDENDKDDDDDDENEDDETDENSNISGDIKDHNNHTNVHLHRPFMQSSASLSGPNAFAPPFYNRPPTPLPPSPSLTSLLRPPFSTTTSRPTTPDTSDGETPNDTEAAVAKSARIATTVPRASPKVPTYEYYGFVLYLTSSFAFSLASYNTGYLTLPMTSIENIVDEAATVAVIDSKGRRRPGGSEKMKPGSVTSQTMSAMHNRRIHGHYASGSNSSAGGDRGGGPSWKELWSEGSDAVMDIPVGGVCEVLYGRDRELDPELVGVEEDDDSHYGRYKTIASPTFLSYEDDAAARRGYRPESSGAYSSSYSSGHPW
ncbi:hypothetical protein PISL3812_09453 [Talaromyces islandicus]|uniref:Uncharacterized protein n=1 Tax=Talaromyces islandicus TaxID=28573 RepID=A0A0U1M9R7_TALIS|nr:hypothetical protein PISL3812_09453 [Talaromyces islandicus]